ncbi:MAG: STAS domain-containing protein [Armatimonadetes bacterium]|nr:STAS domain-containing protein [Armatimonadota bacterium]
MSIDTRLEDGWLAVIKLSGELDAYMAPEVRDRVEEILGTGHSWLLIDLTDVEYMDSVGLGIMVGAAKRANERSGDIAIVCQRPNVLRVFEISGTKDLLNVVATLAEARAVLERSRERAAGEQGASGGEAQ